MFRQVSIRLAIGRCDISGLSNKSKLELLICRTYVQQWSLIDNCYRELLRLNIIAFITFIILNTEYVIIKKIIKEPSTQLMLYKQQRYQWKF